MDEGERTLWLHESLEVRAISDEFTTTRTLVRGDVITIGRGSDADLRLASLGASRRHALLRLGAKHEVQICDLDSANGTVVRRNRLEANVWTDIEPREPFMIAESLLVVHRANTREVIKPLIGAKAFEDRLRVELAEHQLRGRTLGVCLIQCGNNSQKHFDGIINILSAGDACGFLTDSTLALLLADRSPDAVKRVAAEIEAYLDARSATPIVQTACFPQDGSTVEELLAPGTHRDVSTSETMRPPTLVARSPEMQAIHAMVKQIAPTPTSVLILGATGTGKEVLAQAIHQASSRASGPMIALNCAALPENLLESELFGYEKGAFTGAMTAKPGQFELADKGTLFLDEIGDMPLLAQAKVLRVMSERRVLRLGGVKLRPIDVRIIAATNRDLPAMIEAGQFRADLFYRLNGFTFTLPLLRDRADSIVPLTLHFVASAASTLQKKPPAVAPEALNALRAYPWPGNIRELRSVVERAVLLCKSGTVLLDHLPNEVAGRDSGARRRPEAAIAAVPPLSNKSGPVPVTFPDEWEAETAVHTRDFVIPPPSPDTPMAEFGALDASAAMLAKAGLLGRRTQLTREMIVSALEQCGGNQTEAAKVLGIARRTLIARIEQFGIVRPRKGK